jgi:hypothetical protein
MISHERSPIDRRAFLALGLALVPAGALAKEAKSPLTVTYFYLPG